MKILRKIFWRIARRSRLDAQGNPRRTTVVDDWLKRFFEQSHLGQVFRYVSPIEASHMYAIDVEPGADFTAKRMAGKSGLMTCIVSQFDEDPTHFSWLEIGCCDGANLITLYKKGFSDLSGVEINKKFLEAGGRFDGVAFDEIRTSCDSIEHFVATCDRQYDVLFSCAVMQHINPQMNMVLADLARISNRYIVSVEAEDQCNQIHYPRNYKRIFERYGFEQIGSMLIRHDSYPEVEEGYLGYTVRILKRKN